MPSVSILPCLDLKDGRVVKGVHFVDLRDVGDPVEAAQAYAADGARELVVLDISATVENRKTTLDVVTKIAAIPDLTLTVGGGIASVADAREVLAAGANRISVSSAAVRDPKLIDDLAKEIGSERLVIAVDVDRNPACPSGYEVYIDGGRTPTGIDAVQWAKDAENRGAGILLPTSKATDGAKEGYDLPLLGLLKRELSIPVVASGGAGTKEHFLAAAETGADYLLAASVFHFGEIRISELRRYLQAHGFHVQ